MPDSQRRVRTRGVGGRTQGKLTLVGPSWRSQIRQLTRLSCQTARDAPSKSCGALLPVVSVPPLRLGGSQHDPAADGGGAGGAARARCAPRHTRDDDVAAHDEQLHRRTLRKLDFLLLPFLALLFLFNSLDKSNVRVHPRMASNCSSAHAAHR
jgi:hypothetical protein